MTPAMWPRVRDGGLEGFALGGGAAVVPQDRGAQGAVGGVEQDGAVHLAGQADRGGSREGFRGGLAQRGDGLIGGGPPQVGVLFGPQRMRDGSW